MGRRREMIIEAEIGVMQSQTKERQQPTEFGKDLEEVHASNLRGGRHA